MHLRPVVARRGLRAHLRELAAEVEVDPGFLLFVRLRAAGAELTVVSDGFGFYVHDVCAPLGLDVLTNVVDFETRRCSPPRGPLLRMLVVRRVQAGADRDALPGPHHGASATAPATGRLRRSPTWCSPRGRSRPWCAQYGVPCRRFDTLTDVHEALLG